MGYYTVDYCRGGDTRSLDWSSYDPFGILKSQFSGSPDATDDITLRLILGPTYSWDTLYEH